MQLVAPAASPRSTAIFWLICLLPMLSRNRRFEAPAVHFPDGDHHQQRRQCSLCCKARATFGHNVCSPFLRADRPDRAPRTLWTSEHGQSSVSRFSGDSASLSALPVLCALACRPVAAGRCAIHQN
jgi:hypothetical protein